MLLDFTNSIDIVIALGEGGCIGYASLPSPKKVCSLDSKPICITSPVPAFINSQIHSTEAGGGGEGSVGRRRGGDGTEGGGEGEGRGGNALRGEEEGRGGH